MASAAFAERTTQASSVTNTIIFPIADNAVSWALGLVLVFSAVPHIHNPYFFLASVYSYDLASVAVGQLVAMTLPFLQIILAICLVTRLFHTAAHVTTFGMFVGFAGVQISAKLRGLDISCGCFGPRFESDISAVTLWALCGLILLSVSWCVLHLLARGRLRE